MVATTEKSESVQDIVCQICKTNEHSTNNCPTLPSFKECLHEQAHALNSFQMPNHNPYSQTYNPGWRNHPRVITNHAIQLSDDDVLVVPKLLVLKSLREDMKQEQGAASTALDQEWIRWATVSWHGKSFINFSRKLSFAATVYHVWQERNARIFAGLSRTSNLVFNQIECIIRDKLDLMRNVVPTNENKRIQRAWRVNIIDS